MRRLASMAILAVILCAGCSSGGGTTTAKAAASSTQPTSTQPPGAGGGQSPASTNPPTFSGSGGSRYCTLARSVEGSTRLNPTGDLRTAFQKFDQISNEFLSTVPSAIKADARTLVDGLRKLESIMRGVNYDFTKLTPADAQALQDPNFTAASARIVAYDKQVCRLGN